MKLFCIIALLFLFQKGNSQLIGARNFALGNSFLTQEDLLSAQANISKLTSIKGFSFGASSSNQFILKELQQSLIAVGFPLLKGGLALTMGHYGFHLYKEIQFSIAYSIALNPAFSLGININYHKLSIADDLKYEASIFPNIGCNYKFNEVLELSVLLTNITLSKINPLGIHNFPVTFQGGLLYKLNSKMNMYLESVLDLEYSIRFRYGIEYFVLENLNLRTGIATKPASFSMGLAYVIKNISIDASSSYQPALGFSPALSIRYEAK